MNNNITNNNDRFRDLIWQGIVRHTNPIKCDDIKIINVEPGYAKISMPVDENNVNAYNIAHGGALFTLCDMASGMATYAYDVENVTLDANINYIKGAKIGLIYAEAKVIHKGGKTAVIKVDLTNDEGELLAVGTFTMYMKQSIQ